MSWQARPDRAARRPRGHRCWPLARTSWAVVEVVSKLGSFIASFAGSIPSAGRNSMPGTLMFCVSAFKNRQPRILARPPLRSRVAIGGRGPAPPQTRWKLSALSCPISHNRCQPNLQQTPCRLLSQSTHKERSSGTMNLSIYGQTGTESSTVRLATPASSSTDQRRRSARLGDRRAPPSSGHSSPSPRLSCHALHQRWRSWTSWHSGTSRANL